MRAWWLILFLIPTASAAELILEPYYAGHVYEFEADGTDYRLVYLSKDHRGAEIWIVRLPIVGFGHPRAIRLTDNASIDTATITLVDVLDPKTYTTNITLIHRQEDGQYLFETSVPLWSATWTRNEEFFLRSTSTSIDRLTYTTTGSVADWHEHRYHVELEETPSGATLTTPSGTYAFAYGETHELSFQATPIRIAIHAEDVTLEETHDEPVEEVSVSLLRRWWDWLMRALGFEPRKALS